MDTLRARFGPLPVWIWLALITALGLAYYIIQRRKSPAAAASTADAADTGQVPQIVEQTSTTTNVTVPPEAPEPSAPILHIPQEPLPRWPPTSNWPGGRQPGPSQSHSRKPADNERREKDNPADIREDRGEPGEEGPEPRATHHGQHRHHAPPKRHIPPRQPVVRRPMPPPRRAA